MKSDMEASTVTLEQFYKLCEICPYSYCGPACCIRAFILGRHTYLLNDGTMSYDIFKNGAGMGIFASEEEARKCMEKYRPLKCTTLGSVICGGEFFIFRDQDDPLIKIQIFGGEIGYMRKNPDFIVYKSNQDLIVYTK